MHVRIALLRGINVGSSRRLAMADLRLLLEELGYGDVRTYVQSGNIVVASEAPPAQIEQDLRAQIGARFGLDVPVVVRTDEELRDVVARDPLGDVAGDPKRYQVSFLSGAPAAETVRAITALDFAPERVAFSGREIYAWHPAGVHASKLARLLSDARLGVSVTARNWRTVTQLLAMAGDASAPRRSA